MSSGLCIKVPNSCHIFEKPDSETPDLAQCFVKRNRLIVCSQNSSTSVLLGVGSWSTTKCTQHHPNLHNALFFGDSMEQTLRNANERKCHWCYLSFRCNSSLYKDQNSPYKRLCQHFCAAQDSLNNHLERFFRLNQTNLSVKVVLSTAWSWCWHMLY